MKRLPILAKVLLVVFCLSVVLSAQNAGSVVNGRLIIPKVAEAPEIDGELDADWNFPQVGLFTISGDNMPDGVDDCSAWFKMAWNEDGIYIFVNVVDDTIVGHANSWRADNVEFFFDGGNTKSEEMTETDVQWRWVALEDTLALCWNSGANLRPSDYELAWQETAKGYALELALPIEGMTKGDAPIIESLVQGDEIGFEIQVADNDSATGNDYSIRWWTDFGEAYVNPSYWGTLVLGGPSKMLQIPQVEYAPDIDGVLDDDWTDAAVPEITMTVLISESEYEDDVYGFSEDISSAYRAAWNEDGFYFFGRVTDNVVTGDAADDSYNNDCWEIYFDGDNSKEGSYDANDIQWRWVYGRTEQEGGWADVGNWAWMETAEGYDFELEIPVAELQKGGAQLFDLAVGTVIGFETQVADNDGNGRKSMTKWWSESNDSWANPSLFGTAILVLENEDKVLEVAANISLSAPAILTSNATISYTVAARSSVKLSLYNIAGQEVKVLAGGVKDAGTHAVAIDASGLANGVYLVKLDACSESSTQKVTVLK